MEKLKIIGFWVASYTWGIIMALIGSFVALGLLISGHKPFMAGPTVVFEVGESWGGVNFGPFSLVARGSNPSVIWHETGHSLQNIIYGPLFPIIVFIPSVVRYWVMRVKGVDDKLAYLASALVFIGLPVIVPLAIISGVTGNLVLGILVIPWVIYCSSIFIWQFMAIRRFYIKKSDPPYNSIWFERQAESLGKVIYYNW